MAAGLIVAAALVVLLPASVRAECSDPEFCPDDGGPAGGGAANPCWSPELQKDICNDPPEQCPPESDPGWQFIDDRDGSDDGQLAALNRSGEAQACGTITVEKTGYYRIFDVELSESCDSQQDETGFLTVTNSCNPEGWAAEANAGYRYLVLDSDNTPSCSGDQDCAGGTVCRTGNNHGSCCVPAEPTFMGTFLLVAGEDNIICLNHWCPVWKEATQDGAEPGFVTAGCDGVNSIHFRIDTNAVLCEEDTMLNVCTWGCEDGNCLPDPCDSANCPAYCKDGVCLDENPCAGLGCEHGCKNGRCLRPKTAPGPDSDGDGFSRAADCDDNDASVHPDYPEICANSRDDDCDGTVDEADCQSDPFSDAGSGGSGGGGGDDSAADDGCDCALSADQSAPPALVLVLLLLAAACRRRRR